MAKIIGLPKLSPTMEEGTLVRWVKQEGDALEVDDLLAEIETDKATMEFRSFDRGVLLKQLAVEGATLKPDQPVAIIGTAGEDVRALLAKLGITTAGGGQSESPPPKAQVSLPTSRDARADGAVPAALPAPAVTIAVESSLPRGTARFDGPAASAASAQSRVLASPVVRRLAREQEIDLTGITGSGPHGRVVKRDVDDLTARVGLPGAPLRGPSAPPPAMSRTALRSAVEARGSAREQTPDTKPASESRPEGPATPAAASRATATALASGDREEKLSPTRKTIARRLVESKREVPHFYLTIDVDAEPILALRTALNAELPADAAKLSINDFLIKAAATALRRMPRMNTSFAGENIIFHEGVHISVAVAIPDGLLTPVVRHADRLGVLEISRTVRELAARAKDKKLKLEEMQGGTFSISNLGMYGIDSFSAVINPPEGAILAVGAVRDEPVVKNGAVVPGKRMALTVSCDHRVIDGALGAEWLRLLRSLLDVPQRMLM